MKLSKSPKKLKVRYVKWPNVSWFHIKYAWKIILKLLHCGKVGSVAKLIRDNCIGDNQVSNHCGWKCKLFGRTKIVFQKSVREIPTFLNTEMYKNCWIRFEFSIKLRSFSNFADHNPSNERMTFFPFGKTLPTQLSVFFESDSNFDSGQKFKRERSISKLRFKTFLFHLKKTSSLLIVTIEWGLTSASWSFLVSTFESFEYKQVFAF